MIGSKASASLAPHVVTTEEQSALAALQQLGWTYCHAIDRRDYRLLRSLYHDDAIDDHGPMFCGGPDEYVAWLPTMLANWSVTSHVIHNMLFLIDGNLANGELCATAYHRTVDGREVIVHGRYLDQYERRDDIWRILRRSLVLDWSETREASGQDPQAADDGIAAGRPSADDPAFHRLPLFAAQR